VGDRRLYGRKQIYIPTPRFYVLYNGAPTPNKDALLLSDAFLVKDSKAMLASLSYVQLTLA